MVMADPRKLVRRLEPEQADAIRNVVHQHLLAATDVGARAIGCTGASFVVVGLGVWARELSELDARATARYLRAVADILDPRMNDNQKRRAEQERSKAVREIYAALDLEMSEPEGHG